MITIYQKQHHQVVTQPLALGAPIPPDALWIDMFQPTPEEIEHIERELGLELPTAHEVWKNQVLNRMYQEHGNAFMTAALITKTESPYPQTSAVTFILSPGYLLTLREIAPTSFQYFARRIQQSPQSFLSAAHMLEGLLEEVITRVAHNSEVVVDALDDISHKVFSGEVLKYDRKKNTSQQMKEVLTRLGTCADLISKINESLHSLSRLICFFRQAHSAGPEMNAQLDTLLTDINALVQQNGFLSDKITFQLDATLGMINVEQNLIIKIFSVATVFFLPPTLVSSLYGMNFHDMPELSWQFGYPMALSLMVVFALLPYVYFRKKGWL